jgi:hypothetical protein
VIPADKVERIRRDDGSEELLNVRPLAPAPTPPPPPPPATLVVVVGGDTFWQAWDPKAAPQDPSLRLEVRLDDRVVASYTDVNLDPEDLPKAVVNSFVFSPERLFVSATEGVRAALRLAYQVNDAGSSAAQWRDVVLAQGEVELASGTTATVRVVQERGTMDYVKRRMRNVETFRATLEPEPTASGSTAP